MSKVFEKQIAKGVEYLDREQGPNWVRDIDLSILNLGNECNCVVGQLFGEYSELVGRCDDGLDNDDAEELGFFLPGHEDHQYPVLTAEWKEKIEQLRLERRV